MRASPAARRRAAGRLAGRVRSTNVQVRSGPTTRGGEADRGDVALADRAQADGDAGGAGRQAVLVGMKERAGIAQRGGLDGVLGGEASHRAAGVRAPGDRPPSPLCARDDARVLEHQVEVVVVPVPEVCGQPVREHLDLGLGERKDAADDLAARASGAAPRRAGTAARGPASRPARSVGVGRRTSGGAVTSPCTSRRASWAVASIASVDSAPWFSLRTGRLEPVVPAAGRAVEHRGAGVVLAEEPAARRARDRRASAVRAVMR